MTSPTGNPRDTEDFPTTGILKCADLETLDAICFPAPGSGLETRATPAPRAARASFDPTPTGRTPGAPAVRANAALRALTASLDRQNATMDRALSRTSNVEAIQARLRESRARLSHQYKNAVNVRDKAATRRRPDALLDRKIGRIDNALTQTYRDQNREVRELKREVVQLKRQVLRPHGPTARRGGALASGYSTKNQAFAIYRKSVIAYIKTGQDTFNGLSLREMERRAFSTQIGSDGGYLVHPEHDLGPIERLLRDMTPMRQWATVQSISAASYKKPHNLGGSAARWIGETQARPETATPQIVELEFPAMELYAEPTATQTMLEDSQIDVESWLAAEVADDFVEAESAAFISGDGILKPRGLIGGYNKVANSSWSWNNIGYIATGVDAAFATPSPTANPADKLMDVIYATRAAIRQNGAWMMNRSTMSRVRQIKDAEGRFVFREAAERKDYPELCGYPVAEADHMPDIAAGSYSIAFGDYKRAYIIVDRVGMSTLRDPYTSKPYILFYTRKRVGGGMKDFEAVKLLRFGTS